MYAERCESMCVGVSLRPSRSTKPGPLPNPFDLLLAMGCKIVCIDVFVPYYKSLNLFRMFPIYFYASLCSIIYKEPYLSEASFGQCVSRMATLLARLSWSTRVGTFCSAKVIECMCYAGPSPSPASMVWMLWWTMLYIMTWSYFTNFVVFNPNMMFHGRFIDWANVTIIYIAFIRN